VVVDLHGHNLSFRAPTQQVLEGTLNSKER